MAITTSNPDGIQVTSAAKNGTLGSQAGIANNEIEFDTAITTNNGNLAASPLFVGRLVTIRAGAGDEETLYMSANSTTTRAQCHEDWVAIPASGDAYSVWYILADAATLTGLTLASKRVQDYTSGRRFSVISGGYFAFLDGVSLETSDNSSTSVADVRCLSGGRLQNGYLAGGTPVSGGYIIGVPAVNAEWVFDAQSGSIVNLYDFFLTCVTQNKSLLNGDVTTAGAKFFSASYTMDLTGSATDAVLLNDFTVEGKGTTNDTITINQYTVIDDAVIVATNGLRAGTAAETNEVRNTVFTDNNLNLVTVADDAAALWNMVNPTWSVDELLQGALTFTDAAAGANGVVNELYQIDVTAADPSGTPINGAVIHVYEGTQGNNLAYSGTSNSLGQYTGDVLTRNFIPAGNATHITTTSYGGHALRVYDYGNIPFVGALDMSTAVVSAVALSTDAAITETVAATAITNGAGITVAENANSHYVLHYDGGTGTVPTVGEVITVTNAGTNTTGTLVEYIGDAVAGIVVLEGWNATVADDNAAITGSTSGIASLSDPTSAGGGSSFDGAYRWLVKGNSLAMTTIYDYLAAQTGNTTPTATFSDVIEWGQAEQSQLVYSTASGYTTERNVAKTAGVWIANRGAGTVAYFTANDGGTYIPPVQYTYTITNLIAGSEVKAFPTDPTLNPRESIFGTDSSGTSFSYNYTYSGDIGFNLIIFSTSHKERRLNNETLSNANQSQPATQQLDRNYLV
mgnify:CR=1 FL=1